MDIKHPRPRYTDAIGSGNVVSQRHNLGESLVFGVPSSGSLPAYEAGRSLVNNDAENKTNLKKDYQEAAASYKQSELFARIYNYLRIFAIFLAVIVAVLATIGIIINFFYANKALPFAKIGSVSVGGLNRSEISALLQERTKELNVVLIEGGLTRKVAVSEFNPDYDFTQAIDKSIAKRVNPYSFITSNNVSIEAAVNERQVDGYLRQNVTSSQARSQDATIEKTKDAVIIKPEITGFSASTKDVVATINKALTNLDNPVVRLNSVSVPPNIYSSDLKPELDKVNRLLATSLIINYANIKTTISSKQKLEWLTVSKKPGSPGYSFDFSKDSIRSYVIGLAEKYQRPVQINQPENLDNPAGYTVPTVVINNIEQVVDQIYHGLNNAQNIVAVFTLDKSIAQRIPRQEKKENKPSVSLAQARPEQQVPVQDTPTVSQVNSETETIPPLEDEQDLDQSQSLEN